MCTAISLLTKDHYFGRTLDLEYSYEERVAVTPRNFSFKFRMEEELKSHYAIIGMATVTENYPLYYEATNEKGLSVAGLNFPTSAVYEEPEDGKHNIGVFELIPWILGKCSSVDEARELIENTNIIGMDFSNSFPVAYLHWMISDRDYSIVLECTQNGKNIYYNPVSVMTNNPEFPMQIFNLNNYMSLTREEPETRFAEGFNLNKYSNGLGALGLPGDCSSMSRFVRGAFSRLNSVCGESENESISQFFHILGTVSTPLGVVRVGDKFSKTVYTSCCNTDKGIYYYTTYGNNQISAVDMHKENLDSCNLSVYNLVTEQQINFQN